MTQKADQIRVTEGRVVELGCHFELSHRVGFLEDLAWRWVAGVSEGGLQARGQPVHRPRGCGRVRGRLALMSILKG